MMWIICGPSSVGKSTFIESGKAGIFAGLPANTPTIFPVELEKDLDCSNSNYFFHYNILRPLTVLRDAPVTNNIFFKLKTAFIPRARIEKRRDVVKRFLLYEDDISWSKLLSIDCEKKAIILVSSREEIIERVKRRTTVENKTFTKTNQGKYSSSFWLDIYNRIHLEDVYEIWQRELDRCDIPYIYIDTSNENYHVVDNKYLTEVIQS